MIMMMMMIMLREKEEYIAVSYWKNLSAPLSWIPFWSVRIPFEINTNSSCWLIFILQSTKKTQRLKYVYPILTRHIHARCLNIFNKLAQWFAQIAEISPRCFFANYHPPLSNDWFPAATDQGTHVPPVSDQGVTTERQGGGHAQDQSSKYVLNTC